MEKTVLQCFWLNHETKKLLEQEATEQTCTFYREHLREMANLRDDKLVLLLGFI